MQDEITSPGVRNPLAALPVYNIVIAGIQVAEGAKLRLADGIEALQIIQDRFVHGEQADFRIEGDGDHVISVQIHTIKREATNAGVLLYYIGTVCLNGQSSGWVRDSMAIAKLFLPNAILNHARTLSH